MKTPISPQLKILGFRPPNPRIYAYGERAKREERSPEGIGD